MAQKKKFQGQELEEELGKNTYAYQWRDYDPAIGRFNKIDRFSEKYYGISPYAFTANNPIYFKEIKGDSIGAGKDHHQKLKQKAQDVQKGIITKRQAKLAKNKGNEKRTAKLKAKFAAQDANPNSRYNQAIQTEFELNELEDSDVTYNFIANSSDVGANADGNIKYDVESGEVNINVKDKFSAGHFAHEAKHAFQFERGKLSFGSSGEGGLLYDIKDEVEAFARGSTFGGTSMSLKDIKSNYSGISTRTTQRTLNSPSSRSGLSYLQLFQKDSSIERGIQFYNPQ